MEVLYLNLKRIFLCFLILVFVSISGCRPLSPDYYVKSDEELSNNQYSAVEFSIEDLLNSNTKIAIYDISRDTFHQFIDNPSQAFFSKDDCKIYEYIDGEPFFVSNGSNILNLNTDLVKFVNNKSMIKDFLSDQKINGEVEQVITFWAPKVPVTIWIKMDTDNIFITVEQKMFTESLSYEYFVFNYNEYYQKYSPKNASLFVNGNNIETSNNTMIYGEYCEIPFLETLESLGASVKWQTENNVKILYNYNIYYLDIENRYLYSFLMPKKNLLSGLGGFTFFYTVDKDVMICNSLFECAVDAMGKKVLIDIDKDNNIVSVVSR